MRIPFFILPLALTTACSSATRATDTEELLTAYEDALATLHDTTDVYVTATADLGDLSEAESLLTSYDADMHEGLEAMEHALEDIGGCEMDTSGMDNVDGAYGMVDTVTASVTTVEDGHPDHTTVAECQDAAATHEAEVDPLYETMEGYHTDWDGMDMNCSMHEDSMD